MSILTKEAPSAHLPESKQVQEASTFRPSLSLPTEREKNTVGGGLALGSPKGKRHFAKLEKKSSPCSLVRVHTMEWNLLLLWEWCILPLLAKLTVVYIMPQFFLCWEQMIGLKLSCKLHGWVLVQALTPYTPLTAPTWDPPNRVLTAFEIPWGRTLSWGRWHTYS